MKLRMRGPSLRFRLGRGEVARWASEGHLMEFIPLGADPSDLLCVGLLQRDAGEWEVCKREHGWDVQVPKALAQAWCAGVDVGLYHRFPWGLSVAVEKDFQCLDGDVRDDDAYENPKAGNRLP